MGRSLSLFDTLKNHNKIKILDFYKIHRRTMYAAAAAASGLVLKKTLVSRPCTILPKKRDSVFIAYNTTSEDAKLVNTDGKGFHTVGTKAYCNLPNCNIKVCKSLCGELIDIEVIGHFTHKPTTDGTFLTVDTVDYNGNPKTQSFRTDKKTTISTENAKEFTEADLKPNLNATKYGIEKLLDQLP